VPLEEVIIWGQYVHVLRGNSENLRVHREFVSPLIIVVCQVKNLLMVLAVWWLLQRLCGSVLSLMVTSLMGGVSIRTVIQFWFDPVVKSGFWGSFVCFDLLQLVAGV